MSDKFAFLTEKLQYRFKNTDLMTEALRMGFNKDIGYERLEFLGDRVLGLIVAEMLYKRFPKEKEGRLAPRHAYLVSAPVLAQIAEELSLSDDLIIPASELPAINIHSVNLLSDVCEALIGAIYLDGGLKEAEEFIFRFWKPLLTQVEKPPVSAKTKLQEWAQKKGYPLPEYIVLEKKGPQHAPVFKVQVLVKGQKNVSAEGTSKHQAEQRAAEALLSEIGVK